MKIKKNYEENINIDSKAAMEDFTKKQILINILYHKIFLGFCALVNISLFIFIIIYQNQLYQIELITKKYTKEYKKNEATLKEQTSTLEHKIVNLISTSRRSDIFFSYSFLNRTEYEMVQNFIIEYYKNNPSQFTENIFDKYKLNLIYQSTVDPTNFNDIKNMITYERSFLFIIEVLDNKKFGIYVDEAIFFYDRKEYISKENKLFIFSYQSKSMYKYIGEGPALKMNKDKLIDVGNGEIIIYDYFFNNGGYINYPLKNFEGLKNNENGNVFTGKNGSFDIKKIEIFTIVYDEKHYY